MTSIADIKKNNRPLLKQFKEAGIQAELYNRPPVRAGLFTCEVRDNKIRLWPGDTKITADFDPARHQAVLRVDEAERTFKDRGTVTTRHRGWQHPAHFRYEGNYRTAALVCKADACIVAKAAIRRHVRSTWSLPKEARIKILSASWIRKDRCAYSVEITAPASSNSFLMGIDETSHFISQLPSHPSTVRVAHQVLRPTSVPKNALRQGEWFFIPATPEEVEAIVKAYAEPMYNIRSRGAIRQVSEATLRQMGFHRYPRSRVNPTFTMLEGGSSHRVAQGIRIGEDRFATGLVYDTREGRHEPLTLNGWYKVVRNTEVVQRPARQASNTPRRWD